MKLNHAEHAEYRSTTGVAQYAASPRYDIKYSVKELVRLASSPDRGATQMSKRLARYLVGRPRMVWHFWWQKKPDVCRTTVDANHGGCARTGKSSTGMVVFLGKHVLVDLAVTQVLISLSSGESEFYGIIRAVAEAIYLVQFLNHFGHTVECHVLTDSSAAKGMTLSLGLTRRTRHISHKLLWVQQVVKDKRVKILKTEGEENEADIDTKYTTAKIQDYLLSKLPLTFLTFAGQVIPLNAKEDWSEDRERMLNSLAAMNGFMMVLVSVLVIICLWMCWQGRGQRKEIEKLKECIAKQRKKEKKRDETQSSEADERSSSGASSPGINRATRRGISHLPTTAECEMCELPQQRVTTRRSIESIDTRDADPTISGDDFYPATTYCRTCQERVNVWTVHDNKNGNKGRKYCKCSQGHFFWCDWVSWENGVKVLRKKGGL